MGEIAGERSQIAIGDLGASAGVLLQAVPTSAAGPSRERIGGGAIMAVDGVVLLILLSVLSYAGSHAGGFALLAFGLLSYVLLRPAAAYFGARPVLELAAIPTATAAVTLVLWSAPMVGFGGALSDAVLVWLVTTAALVGARLALRGVASNIRTHRVIWTLDAALKRVFDFGVAAFILLLTAPISLAVAVAILIDDRGPILYRCERVGAHGRRLQLIKFRKMRKDAAGPRLTASDDDRFTRVGQFLARSKLDELPQLWNVLRGQMSLVGPRPEDPEFVEPYASEFAEISSVRPGVTGLCQLAFAKESEIIDGDDPVRAYMEYYLPQKLKIDRLYVEQRTFLFDLKVLFWTALVLVRKDVAVNRQTGELSLRRRRELAESASRAA